MRQNIRYPHRWYWIFLIIGTVGPGLINAGLEYFAAGDAKAWEPIAWSLGGGSVTVFILWLLSALWPAHEAQLRPRAEETPQAARAEPIPQANALARQRSISPRTPVQIVDELEGHTEMTQERLIERHIGAWLEVTGVITNVSHRRHKQTISVSMQGSQDEITFFLEFDANVWNSIFRSSNIGDHISARGEIVRIRAFQHREAYIALGQCELVINDN